MSAGKAYKKPVARRTRATRKQDHVIQTLRSEILKGELTPNNQLPAHPELARRFGVSSVTIRLAMNRLAREGFVEAHHRRGTFVTPKPPHVNNYALVFWNEPISSDHAMPQFAATWSRYYVALTNEAIRMQQEEGRRMLLFHGIDQHTDTDDHQRLLSYIHAYRLAGIIFANWPFGLEGSPIVDAPGIPRVAFTSRQAHAQVKAISFDQTTWLDKALNWLLKHGRKRVAFLLPGANPESDAQISKAIATRGMESPPYWRQVVARNVWHTVQNCVHLLMRGAAGDRPDALVVTDDNFVDNVQKGLIAAGVRVPDDVMVIAHANFPWPPPTVLPIKLLGYDIRGALRTCVELIDRQRRNEGTPCVTMLPPVFEEELAASKPATISEKQSAEVTL